MKEIETGVRLFSRRGTLDHILLYDRKVYLVVGDVAQIVWIGDCFVTANVECYDTIRGVFVFYPPQTPQKSTWRGLTLEEVTTKFTFALDDSGELRVCRKKVAKVI